MPSSEPSAGQAKPRDLVIAVDGPSGSGKSSTSRGVAKALGLRYLDTGAMYRAVTWWMLRAGVDVDDAQAVAAHAGQPVLRSGTDPGAPAISVDGVDVSGPIRTAEVTTAVSAVSAVPEVRAVLLQQQRVIIQQACTGAGGIVVEGRDIGAVVAPDAEVKVYLTAEQGARAQRRSAELAAGSVPGSSMLTSTAADLARRDQIDSGRAASPLRQADGAVVLDTTHLTLDDAIAAVVDMAKEHR
ncbi:MAG TPA: (d)CMP kinase [Nocardioidaceae bacterium]|nr:(d)CMP kinase [Nocardioidaceae bacterium]